MYFSYVPRKLKQAREDIAILHNSVNEPIRVTDSGELRNLIMSLVKLEKYQIRPRAYALSNKEIEAVAGYIPHNYYSVNMDNLFEIFTLRSSERLCRVLFNQWQESYQNRACNGFMRRILRFDENLISLILSNNMDETIFDSVLSDSNVALRFGMEVNKRTFAGRKTLADKLSYFGIREESKLCTDCKFWFYTYCSKQDYLAVEKTELLKLAMQYNRHGQTALRKFLSNFLEKLTLRELIWFRTLADYLKTIIGDNVTDKEKLKSFFVGVQPFLEQKYIDWINLYKVEEYFGNDDRSRFWRQYHFKSVRKFNYSNSVVMEFERYYAVEFLGQAMGPIYIYSKDYFENYIIYKFRNNDNLHMRQELYQGRKWFFRKEHRGNWQKDVHSVLIRNSITNRIDL